MKVLVACEYSGIVRDAFIRKGHDAISVDLLPSESSLGPHFEGDIFKYLNQSHIIPYTFDLMIAHPPCTYLANSGVRWLKNNQERYKLMIEACEFFDRLLVQPIKRICIENPIHHKYARENLLTNYSQIIQPWQFGHGETKATCLWLKSLPKLKPTNIVEGRESRIHKMAPGPNRSKERSRFFVGIAEAMAEQWG